jgi:Ca2+/Na+ antiporter
MYQIINFFENFYYKFIAMPLVIRIAVVTTILLILLLLFYAFLSLLNYYNKKERDKREDQRKSNSDCYKVLKGILTSNNTIAFTSLKYDFKSIQSKCHMKLEDTVYEMLVIKNEFPSEFNYENLQTLSRLFNLTPYWDEKLTDKSLKVKMENLQHIIELRATVSESVLSTLVYHKNSELRKKARIAQIHLSQHEPFKFFDEEFDKDFTVWDKSKIHDILLHKPTQTIPNFIRWIPKVKNENLQSLFIYEIGYYNQIENREFLFDLFKITPSDEVKIQIVETLNKLGIETMAFNLIKHYHVCSENVQLSIINNLKHIQTDQLLLPFYVHAFEKAYETDLKLALGEAIYKSKTNGHRVIKVLESKAKGFNKLVFEHIKNPLLLN